MSGFSNIRLFDKKINSFLKKVEGKTKENCLKKSFTVYSDILKWAPVLTGNFRYNTHFALDGQATEEIREPKNKPVKFSPPNSSEVNFSKFKKISKEFKLGNNIYIYNDLPYAYKVEVIGWNGTPPYAPFIKAVANANVNNLFKTITVTGRYGYY